jgi:transcriptional regulator GlxA family with amidase domain
MNVGIFIFENVDLLDFAGPYEVYTTANELEENLFNVFTVSINKKIVKTANGLSVNSDFLIDDHPDIDILVLPGGIGGKALMNNEILRKWILRQSERCKVIYTVCTGFRLLKNTGLLTKKRSTTHHLHFDELREMIPDTNVEEGIRFIDEGNIMTSAGMTAGIDLAIHTIKIYKSKDLANRVRDFMEFK